MFPLGIVFGMILMFISFVIYGIWLDSKKENPKDTDHINISVSHENLIIILQYLNTHPLHLDILDALNEEEKRDLYNTIKFMEAFDDL